jgi:hypothetical protein
MTSLVRVLPLVGMSLVAVFGCGDDSEGAGGANSSTNDGGGGGTAGMGGVPAVGGSGGQPMAMPIPDCGAATDLWLEPDSQFNGGGGPDYGTPATAWQVGTANDANPYVQGNIGASGSAFFVFCAGAALSQISINLNDLDGSGFTTIHIHEGAGDVFGAEVTPTMTSAVGGSWPLTPGETYVFEVSNDPDAFF